MGPTEGAAHLTGCWGSVSLWGQWIFRGPGILTSAYGRLFGGDCCWLTLRSVSLRGSQFLISCLSKAGGCRWLIGLTKQVHGGELLINSTGLKAVLMVTHYHGYRQISPFPCLWGLYHFQWGSNFFFSKWWKRGKYYVLMCFISFYNVSSWKLGTLFLWV